MVIDTNCIDLAAIIEDQRRFFAVVVPVELSPGLVGLRLRRPISRPVAPSAPPRGALLSDSAARRLAWAEDKCIA